MFRKFGLGLPLDLSLVTCILILSEVAYSQDACEKLTSSDLGRSNMLMNEGLVAEVLSPSAQGGSLSVSVRIMDMNIVCEAQHMMEDRYRYTSVVVSFNCETTDVQVPECADNSVVHTEQFDFGCDSGQWSLTILTISDLARTQDPLATLTTPLDTSCLLCINPNHTAAPNTVSNVTHCQSCTGCTMGLQRCYEDESFTEVCCSYFDESGNCVTDCPNSLIPDDNFMCVMPGTMTTPPPATMTTPQSTTMTTPPPTTVTTPQSTTTPPSTTTGCEVSCYVPIIVVLLAVILIIIAIGTTIGVVHCVKKNRKAKKTQDLPAVDLVEKGDHKH